MHIYDIYLMLHISCIMYMVRYLHCLPVVLPWEQFICLFVYIFNVIFIGPESDHWECLSLTDSLTDSLLFSKLD